MKQLIVLTLLILTINMSNAQLNITVKEVAENHIIISGTGNLPATPPSAWKYVIQLEDLVEENASGAYTVVNNTLKFGTVVVNSSIVYTNGNFALQSSNTETIPFVANSPISGEMEIIFHNIQVRAPKTTNSVFWGLNANTLVTAGIFSIVGAQVIVDGDLKVDALKIKNPILFRAETNLDIDWQSQPNDTITLENLWTNNTTTIYPMTYDASNNFDSATGEFTVPCSGYYRFDIHLLFSGERFFDHIFDLFISIDDDLTNRVVKDQFTLTTGGNTSTSFPAKMSHSFGATLFLETGEKLSLKMAFLDAVGFGTFIMQAKSSFSGRLLNY